MGMGTGLRARKRGWGTVTCLDEVVLRPFGVHPAAGGAPGEVADEVPAAAHWEVRDTHVLGPERDEVVDWRRVVPLDVCAEELAACSNSVRLIQTLTGDPTTD